MDGSESKRASSAPSEPEGMTSHETERADAQKPTAEAMRESRYTTVSPSLISVRAEAEAAGGSTHR